MTPEQEQDVWQRLEDLEDAEQARSIAEDLREKAEQRRAQWFRYGLTTAIAVLGMIAVPLVVMWITLHQSGVKP